MISNRQRRGNEDTHTAKNRQRETMYPHPSGQFISEQSVCPPAIRRKSNRRWLTFGLNYERERTGSYLHVRPIVRQT